MKSKDGKYWSSKKDADGQMVKRFGKTVSLFDDEKIYMYIF